MNIDISVRRMVKDTGEVVCFMHAVQLALKGIAIEEEYDEFRASGNDMRNTSCFYCSANIEIPAEEPRIEVYMVNDMSVHKETI